MEDDETEGCMTVEEQTIWNYAMHTDPVKMTWKMTAVMAPYLSLK